MRSKFAVLALSLLFASISQAGTPSPLAGDYVLTSVACFGYLNPSTQGQQFRIIADDSHLAFGFIGQAPGASGIAFSEQENDNIGDTGIVHAGLGNADYRQVASYSANGMEFDHAEYDSITRGSPLRLLRTTNIVLEGDIVTITLTEAGSAPRICKATRL